MRPLRGFAVTHSDIRSLSMRSSAYFSRTAALSAPCNALISSLRRFRSDSDTSNVFFSLRVAAPRRPEIDASSPFLAFLVLRR